MPEFIACNLFGTAEVSIRTINIIEENLVVNVIFSSDCAVTVSLTDGIQLNTIRVFEVSWVSGMSSERKIGLMLGLSVLGHYKNCQVYFWFPSNIPNCRTG